MTLVTKMPRLHVVSSGFRACALELNIAEKSVPLTVYCHILIKDHDQKIHPCYEYVPVYSQC